MSGKADAGERGLRLAGRLRAPIRAKAVFMPLLSESPALGQGEGATSGTIPLLTPAIDVLFRPEQEHGFSGEHDIVIPVTRWNGDVDHTLSVPQRTALYAHRHGKIATATSAVDPCVRVEHRGMPRASQMQLPYQDRLPTCTGNGVGTAEKGAARHSSPSCKTKA